MSAIAIPRSQPRKRGPVSELLLSFYAVLGITALYLLVVLRIGIPRASGFFGHTFGVLGFLLMLMTETLYSIRKRQRGKAWGKMSDWLRFHVFTGLVGPYMVFLHAAWSFKGLAGITLLLTGIVVVSGFVGRYIYTAVPRTADGVVLEAREIQLQLSATDGKLGRHLHQTHLQEHGRTRDPRPVPFPATRGQQPPQDIGAERAFLGQKPLHRPGRAKAAEIRALQKRRRQLERQLASLATARRLLAAWHSIHIPLGMALFASALFHTAAAIYYATLLRW